MMTGPEYEKRIILQGDDCEGGRLKTPELFRLFQGVSEEHVRLLELGESEPLMSGKFWAVTNYRCEITRMPRPGEAIALKTAALKSVHMLFPRCYRLFAEDGELLSECSSRWVIVDSVKRAAADPKSIAGLNEKLENAANTFQNLADSRRLAPAGAVRPCEITRVMPFDPPREYFDKNGHMNNAAYFGMAETLLAAEISGKSPVFLQIEYRNELAPGQALEVGIGEYAAADGMTGFFLSGKSGESSTFRMRAEYR